VLGFGLGDAFVLGTTNVSRSSWIDGPDLA
jgi:hypothetical protein